jgi:tetratricopeptide (TPR) repeat protein
MPLICLSGACQRDDGAEPAVGDDFVLPEVDTSTLSEGLQERLQIMRAAARQSPKDPQQAGILGAIYYVHGFPDAAVPCFKRAKELAPPTLHWWYYLALAYDRLGEREKAIEAYERGLELDANYGPLYVRLADLLVDTNRERAVSLCQRALELNPSDSAALFTLGLCAEAAGDQTTALQRYEEALKIAPTYKEAHEAMAAILAGVGRDEEAEQHRAAAAVGRTIAVVDDRLLELMLRNGLHLQTLLRDVGGLAERGLFQEADRALALAADVDPTGTATHVATGIARAMQGRFEEAAEEYRLALEAEPDRLDVKVRLANVQARLGEHQEAEAGFRAVLEQSPDDVHALERYSELLLTLGRGAEAERLLRESTQRQPTNAQIAFQLGVVLYFMQNHDAAHEQFEAALAITPEDAGAHHYLGLLAQRAGDLPRAKKHWARAIEANPTFLDSFLALTDVTLKERDFSTAEGYIRAALRQSPDHPGLANGLAWILATSPNEDQRNGGEAVGLAEKACELTQRQVHQLLDTLAAAYAEVGRFDDAVKTVREALALLTEQAGDQDIAAKYQQRLELYEKKQPYRDVE